ncbi:MAG: hypothetical protein NTZ93_03670 [Candidatus Beckwithbacteria bacterium]|nr:hypothetical protein [Candidatus Beckwithbacteria bacterium]
MSEKPKLTLSDQQVAIGVANPEQAKKPTPILFENVTMQRAQGESMIGVNIRFAGDGDGFFVQTPDGNMAAIIKRETMDVILSGKPVVINI